MLQLVASEINFLAPQAIQCVRNPLVRTTLASVRESMSAPAHQVHIHTNLISTGTKGACFDASPMIRLSFDVGAHAYARLHAWHEDGMLGSPQTCAWTAAPRSDGKTHSGGSVMDLAQRPWITIQRFVEGRILQRSGLEK